MPWGLPPEKALPIWTLAACPVRQERPAGERQDNARIDGYLKSGSAVNEQASMVLFAVTVSAAVSFTISVAVAVAMLLA